MELSSLIERYRQWTTAIARSHPKVVTSSTAILAVLALVFPRCRKDYRTYLSYGPGGLPYNILGWFVSAVILRSFSRDTLSTTVYASSADERRFLPASFPPRERGPRPRLGPHPVPQRQMDQLPKRDVSAELERRFEALARRNEQLVEMRMSVHERHTQALFVKSGREMHEVAKEMLGEVSHIHGTGDHSVHVVLAPSDCEKIIESGWGQRHELDGVGAMKYLAGFTLPVNYVLLYAPRDAEELDIVMETVRASIAFMTGGDVA